MDYNLFLSNLHDHQFQQIEHKQVYNFHQPILMVITFEIEHVDMLSVQDRVNTIPMV